MLPTTQPDFGAALQAWRKEHGLSQADAAARLGVQVRALQRWEAGESTPRHTVLARIQTAIEANGTAQLDRIEAKLDEVLSLLRGRTKPGKK